MHVDHDVMVENNDGETANSIYHRSCLEPIRNRSLYSLLIPRMSRMCFDNTENYFDDLYANHATISIFGQKFVNLHTTTDSIDVKRSMRQYDQINSHV